MALPKFEDWKAPWEEKGEEVDPERIKKHLWNLLSDKERLQGTVETVTGERDQLKGKVTEAERKDLSELDRLRAELADAQSASKPDPAADLRTARLELALEHGLTKTQAQRLVGTTPEELAADVSVLLGDLGAGQTKPDTDEPPAGRFQTGQKGKDVPERDIAKLGALFD